MLFDLLKRLNLIAFVCGFFSLVAKPSGFQSIVGDVSPPKVDANGVLVITSGNQAIIHWDQFSIGKNEAVRFDQLNAQSCVLNRVIGFSESRIDGSLLSNGRIFLINQHGVVIGPNGKIETAAFIGSTLDLLDEDFLKGVDFPFKGTSNQSIVNLGTIEASNGDVFLIGAKAKNRGLLKAEKGFVGVESGRDILIRPQGAERIFVRVPVEDTDELPLEQSGLIESMQCELRAGIRPYTKAINAKNSSDAYLTVEKDGKLYLTQDSHFSPKSMNEHTESFVCDNWDQKIKQYNPYEHSAILLPSGQAYKIFYKVGSSPPIPPAPTPIPTPSSNPVYNTTVSSSSTVSTIIMTSDADTSSVMQGPSTQGQENPVDSQDQTTPYNNDSRGGSSC